MGVLYFLLMLFLGMVIGGFATGKTFVGIIGLVLFLADAVIGILIYYNKQKKVSHSSNGYILNESPHADIDMEEDSYSIGKSLNQAFETVIAINKKVQILKSNHTAIQTFTQSELVCCVVNLAEAQMELSTKEFFYVNAIYEKYRLSKSPLRLNFEGYLNTSDEIIAHFDLIAPWYKFCGDDSLRMTGEIAKFADQEKAIYRRRAWNLIESNKIFGEEWVALQKDFRNEFYSEWSI